jgi:hypothetical protein
MTSVRLRRLQELSDKPGHRRDLVFYRMRRKEPELVNRRQSADQYTAHIYQIYIAASPQQVWAAITESEWTRQYFHSTSFVEPPQQARPYRTFTADGRPAI